MPASLIILIISQLRQKKKLAEQFEKMSIRDPLTKLGDRRFLQQNIGRELAYINRIRNNDKDAALGVYLFDIAHFKSINDTYGHKAGDEVLVEISQRIAIATRETDLLARWGGEEFIYLARVDNDARVYQLAERVLSAVNGKEFIVSDHPPIKVTCTLGVVKYPFIDTDNSELWDRLISMADAALYYGKQKQRNCWVVINNENIHQKEDIDTILQNSLEQAVEKSMISIKTSFD
jgi:two-component system, cell cycle response regulator